MSGNLRRGVCIRRVYSYRTERIRVNNPEPRSEIRKNLAVPSNPPAPQSCPLLARLPIEVRLQIWNYILANKTFHIQLQPGRLASRVCEDCSEEHQECHTQWHGRLTPPTFEVEQNTYLQVSSLLRVCQQVYDETCDLLYSGNTIEISDLGILKYFLQGAPPERIPSIRSICVHWLDESWSVWPRRVLSGPVGFGGTWEMFWRLALAEMKGLTTITIMMCTSEEENRMAEQASLSFNKQRELREWDFSWDPQATTRCRMVKGRKKSVDV